MPVDRLEKAIFLGMIWGWLPCGLIYSALAYSATADSVSGAAAIMFSFALGTLPAVILGSVIMEKIMSVLRHQGFRAIMAVLLIIFGVFTLYFALSHNHNHDHNQDHNHDHHHNHTHNHNDSIGEAQHHHHH